MLVPVAKNKPCFVNELALKWVPAETLCGFVGAGYGAHLVQTPPTGVQGNPWPGTIVISTNCASQFRLFPKFLLSVLLLLVIWSYPGQGYNSSTGHFVWLVPSPGTVYHLTFVRHLHYQRSKTC